jgi:hypothetical protein
MPSLGHPRHRHSKRPSLSRIVAIPQFAMGTYSQPLSPSPITQSEWSLSDPNIGAISQERVGAMQSRCIGSGDRRGSRVGTVQWHGLYTSPAFRHRATQLTLTLTLGLTRKTPSGL